MDKLSNVVLFPPQITAQHAVRNARRMVEHLEREIDACDPDSADIKERVTAGVAPGLLEYWREELRQAEVELAAWQDPRVLSYAGKVYPQTEGRA